jgi:hypothetical protein
MDSFISVPRSATASAATSPATVDPGMKKSSPRTVTPVRSSVEANTTEVKVEEDSIASKEDNSEHRRVLAIENLRELDPLAMVVELLENVTSGKIGAKDVYNEAGPIRSRLSKAKASLQDLEGLDQDMDVRNRMISQLNIKIGRQVELLKSFRTAMGVKVESAKMDVDSKNMEPNFDAMSLDMEYQVKKENNNGDSNEANQVNGNTTGQFNNDLVMEMDLDPIGLSMENLDEFNQL